MLVNYGCNLRSKRCLYKILFNERVYTAAKFIKCIYWFNSKLYSSFSILSRNIMYLDNFVANLAYKLD